VLAGGVRSELLVELVLYLEFYLAGLYPPRFDSSDDVLRNSKYFSDYDDLLGSFLHSGSIKEAEVL
jgi:hypothetical protein